MYNKDGKEDFSVVKTKEVYLPKGADWVDFWTGDKLAGGQKINREVPFDVMPLYVKAGSILPVGPKVQYAAEKKWDNLEIRIYVGANGEFTLYEDEGDNYNYEKGAYSTISFNWNNSKKTLTIGDRKGTFAGMIADRKFNIVLVGKNNGAGMGEAVKFDKTTTYSGKKVEVKL
jgi:alpha-D-xyloside xylohydrolase